MLKSLFVIFTLGCIFFANSSFSPKSEPSLFKFERYNFQNQSKKLSGYWEFYYNQLLTPNEIEGFEYETIKVPSSWKYLDKELLGVATYRTRVILPKDYSDLVLYIPVVNSAAKVFINDIEILEVGKVSSLRTEYEGTLQSIIAAIPNDLDTAEIVIQTANFSYFSSGLVSSPQISHTQYIYQKKTRDNGVENFLAGSLIAIFIFQMFLYSLYQRVKPNLWIALICLGVALRSMILHGGSFLLPNVFPFVPYEIWKKIEFGSVYLITALFPLYIHHLFKPYSYKKIVYFFVILASILTVPVLFTPQYIYGQWLDICHLGLLLAFIYAIFVLVKACKGRDRNAKFIFWGILACFPFILVEILQNSFLLRIRSNFEYLVECGVLVFLLFQVYILAKQFAVSFKKLEILNLELEEQVEERTNELNESNKVKDRLLSVISHDVKSPLNSLYSLISLHTSHSLSKEEFEVFVKKVEDDLGKTLNLVNNVLFWTSHQRKGNGPDISNFQVHTLIEEIFNQVGIQAKSKGVNLINNVEKKVSITSDVGILYFCIRNLLTNAIKFSHAGGEVCLNSKIKENEIIIDVKDNGVGMSEDQLSQVFLKTSKSTVGTNNEKGTGLGLSLIVEYLKQINGNVTVNSLIGKGTTFTIKIPIKFDQENNRPQNDLFSFFA